MHARLPAGSHGSPALDAAAVALADTLTVALYRVAATFGEGLPKVGRAMRGAVCGMRIGGPSGARGHAAWYPGRRAGHAFCGGPGHKAPSEGQGRTPRVQLQLIVALDNPVQVLADSGAKPAYGTLAEAAALLQLFLKGQA